MAAAAPRTRPGASTATTTNANTAATSPTSPPPPPPAYPLYGTTFTAYRLSPLYHGAPSPANPPLLSPPALRLHARRLADLLRRDTLRGVRVDFGPAGGDAGAAAHGALRECVWDVLGDEDAWVRAPKAGGEVAGGMEDGREEEEEEVDELSTSAADVRSGREDGVGVGRAREESGARGIHVQLRYERATYTALFLRDPEDGAAAVPEGFTHLPLMLVRMPAALKEMFVEHVASTFDARVSPMRLRNAFLNDVLEGVLRDVGRAGDDDGEEADAQAGTQESGALAGSSSSATTTTEEVDDAITAAREFKLSPTPDPVFTSTIKSLQIQLAFPHAAPQLKSLDVRIAKEDMQQFVARGRVLLTLRQQQPQPHTQPTSLSTTQTPAGPFSAALAHYLTAHLALRPMHPAVSISRTACGLFALSSDAKIKLTPPPSAFLPSAAADQDPAAAADPAAQDSRDARARVRRAMRGLYAALLREARGEPLAAALATHGAAARRGAGTSAARAAKAKGTSRSASPSKRARSGQAAAGGSAAGRKRGAREEEDDNDEGSEDEDEDGGEGVARARRRKVGGGGMGESAERGRVEEEVVEGEVVAGRAGGQPLRLPTSPPPPYELHDPYARGGGGRGGAAAAAAAR
ncbi:kinetochore complex Sim4 subunit Fta1-domain-containing protein [Lineolata rhizophorae]|uniref:Kinetochore complex Sim4 subunit Fta1-domain-containing protein n=1 Tax=Lineolata rhizophorae TaxID=578093 RepID=A0A6A6NX33_9PEZI|nr:kinetochore complex Sim4 subunit Fta1-domain-containing protein [Lineolata rhizophorae]